VDRNNQATYPGEVLPQRRATPLVALTVGGGGEDGGAGQTGSQVKEKSAIPRRRGERGFRGGQRLSRAGLISGTHAPKPEAILLKSRRTVPDTLWDMPRTPAHFIHRG